MRDIFKLTLPKMIVAREDCIALSNLSSDRMMEGKRQKKSRGKVLVTLFRSLPGNFQGESRLIISLMSSNVSQRLNTLHEVL